MYWKLWICTFSTILAIAIGGRLSKFIHDFDVLTYDTNHVHEQHKRAIRSPPVDNEVELTFHAHGSNFQLKLKPDSSLLSNKFVLVGSDGSDWSDVADVVHFYKGHITDIPGSFVHGSIVDGHFQGRILSKDDKFSVEPAARYFNDTNLEFHSVIYKDSQVDIPENAAGGCGVVGKLQEQMNKKLEEANKNHIKIHDDSKDDGTHRYKRQATKQTCALHLITDHVYYNRYPDKNEIFRQMGEHVQAATRVFSGHNFQNGFDSIEFAIKKITLYDESDVGTGYIFDSDFIGVEKFLDLTSDIPTNQDYCLVFTFTNRDFANGVLGLAWIATPTSTAGGVCSSDFNAGIVTANNYGQDVPPLVSQLTFAHELGHSFGSRHDPDGDRVCTPGGSEGNFLMFAHASSGDLPNNNDFSECSERNITRVLATNSRTTCLLERGEVTLCGNQVREPTEECDCGQNDECGDQCCTNECTLAGGAICSPQQGVCCSSDCQFEQRSFTCAQETECHFNASCDGNNAECPTPNPKADDIICDNGRKICHKGECNRSICERTGGQPCQCAGDSEKCLVCCMAQDSNECKVYMTSEEKTLTLDVGSPCESFMGYCDVFFECRLAQEDGPLAVIIRGIFYSDEPQLADAILSWLQMYWWVVVIVSLFLIGVMALIMFLCNLLIPTDNPWKEEVHNARRNRVSLKTRRDRGSQYPRSAPRDDDKTITAF